MNPYGRSFYEFNSSGSPASASEVVPIILGLIPINSVCDVGCGIGAWLSVFLEHGVSDVLGIDGGYVPRDMLRIPETSFLTTDLRQQLEISRTFDLAISLEVAEHLPSSCARQFVSELVRLAPMILFSAAIPGQGGTEHLNEQWPEYWDELFTDCGYIPVDALRWRIWNNKRVDFWYRQNLQLYVKQAFLSRYTKLLEPVPILQLPRSLVHPDLYQSRQPAAEYFFSTLKKLPLLFGAALRRRLGKYQ